MTFAWPTTAFLDPLAGQSARGSDRLHDWLLRLLEACAMSRIDGASLSQVVPDTSPGLSEADADDVAATLAGDGEAYRRLVQRYQQEIAVQMRRFSRDQVVCEELVHEVFVEAYCSLHCYRGKAPWLHWLRKIAVRLGYRFWTKQKSRRVEVVLADEDWQQLAGTLPAPDEESDAAELVFALLAQLGPSDRLVLTLLYLDGCTMAEAAARGGWTVVGTKVRAFRARNRLKALLERGPS